jgi:two-component system CheB/CheR fusion protein
MSNRPRKLRGETPSDLPAQAPERSVHSRSSDFEAVAVGGCSRSLESLSAFLGALPRTPEMSFLVLVHGNPREHRTVFETVSRSTQLSVIAGEEGMELAANTVYVLPVRGDLFVEKGVLRRRSRLRGALTGLPIDLFFAALAVDLGERVIGVLLSGAGQDGARGMAVIQEHGGVTFAEAHSASGFSGMAQGAIQAGTADEVLPPEAIAVALEKVAQRRKSLQVGGDGSPWQVIFRMLKASSGVSFFHYKQSTLRRRIGRRMALASIPKVQDYAELLEENPKELHSLFNDLLINVTSFFRDPSVYQALKRSVLPRLIQSLPPSQKEIRIWVPGCSTGEEVYSIAICLLETLPRLLVDARIQIFGTDLSERAIAKARAGLYPASIAREVNSERLRRYFVKKEGGYQISRELRELCTFARQNLCEDPPFSRLDLISCRNVLIYFGPELQRKCVPIFHYALNPQGCLILGTSETIGGFADLFALVDKKNKIYTKKVTDLPVRDLPLGRARSVDFKSPSLPLPAAPVRPVDSANDVHRAADQLLLTHFASCGVVIDRLLQVWHFRGNTAPYMVHAPGAASLNLFKMVRPELAADVSAAVHHCLKLGAGVRKENLHFEQDGAVRYMNLEVVPFAVAPSSEPWLLVIFEPLRQVPLPVIAGKESAPDSAYAREIARLRAELASTKESLQAIIEEQEAANEELKSANEEIESSNEELQSSNEELETAKEELQSTNEELTTVNDELHLRNQEMNELNGELQNLLRSIHLPVVLVDENLTIRRATALAERLFNVIPSDVGRPLSDINPSVYGADLHGMIRRVLEHLSPQECEVRDADGRVYCLRVRPYRTRENRIEGAVMTLLDIHDLRREPSPSQHGPEN